MIVLLAVFILTLLIFGPDFLKKYVKNKKISEHIDQLPGPKWYPVIGTVGDFIFVSRKDRWNLFKAKFRKYSPIYRDWIGSVPVVTLMKPQHCEVVMKDNVNLKKGFGYRFLMPWLGGGLATAHGNEWKEHRRLLDPGFHMKNLDKYSDVFNEKAQILTSIFEKKQGEFFSAIPYFTRCALDAISECAMGVKFNCMKDLDSPYSAAQFGILETASERLTNPFLESDFIFNLSSTGKKFNGCLKIINDTNSKIIRERLKEYRKSRQNPIQQSTTIDEFVKKERPCFLDILIQAQEKYDLTDRYMLDEVNTFMFGGNDTTATTVSYTLFELANNPEIQARVHEELDSIFGDDDRPVTPQDINEMEYLDRCVKETLRLHTVIPLVPREIEQEIEIDGIKIPPGTNIILNLYSLHRDPEQYEHPDIYDPDHFLPEEVSKRHAFAYAPFNLGPRICIGAKFSSRNSRTLLAKILRKFSVQCQEKLEELEEYAELVMKPQTGFHFKFELRKNK